MHFVLILYCLCIWCVESNTSSSLLPNKRDATESKYETITMQMTICNASYAENENLPYAENENLMYAENENLMYAENENLKYAENASFQRQRLFIYLLDNPTTTKSTDNNYSHLSKEFLNCTAHTNVEPGCYEVCPDESVYVPAYKKVIDNTNYIIRENQLYLCPEFFDELLYNDKYSKNLVTISIVGASISSVCIILHMIMFCIMQKMRNLPGYCLFSLCISLLMTYTVFLVSVKQVKSKRTDCTIVVSKQIDCMVIAMFMLYSFLSSFFWMNVMSFDVWYAIRLATCKLRLNTDQSMRKRFSFYSGYAWGMPLFIIAVAFMGDHFIKDQRFRLTFRDTTCWFQNKNALLIYFALPVFLILVANFIFFVDSFRMVIKSRADSGSEEAYNLRSRLFLSLRLGSAMGLMWIFGVIYNFTNNDVIDYFHALCTALQGVFIFFSFTLNKRTKKACKRAMQSKKISMTSFVSNLRKISAVSMTESISSCKNECKPKISSCHKSSP